MTRFLHWRKMTWAIGVWISLGAGWVVGSAGAPSVGLVALWLAVLAVLGVVWFATRPLWRQGHGARLRRLQRPLAP